MIISPPQKCAINVWCMFHPGTRLLNINIKRNHNRVVLLLLIKNGLIQRACAFVGMLREYKKRELKVFQTQGNAVCM